MYEDQIISFDKGKIGLLQKVAQVEEKAYIEGKEVFQCLIHAVANEYK